MRHDGHVPEKAHAATKQSHLKSRLKQASPSPTNENMVQITSSVGVLKGGRVSCTVVLFVGLNPHLFSHTGGLVSGGTFILLPLLLEY